MIVRFARSRYDAEIARIAWPALGALAADPLVSLVDTAFVGRLGAEALAGVAIASAIFAIAFAVFNFLEYAVTPLVASDYGAGNLKGAGATTGAAFALAFGAGLAAAGLLALIGEPLLGLFGATDTVLAEATAYLQIRLLAMPAVLTVMVGHGAFRGYQDTRTPLMVTLGLNAINLVLDPVLIFGLDWGVAGAATATVVAQWTGAIWFWCLVFWRRRRALGVNFSGLQESVVGPLLGAGGRLVFRNASLLAAITASTIAASRIGTAAVAAHQIALQLWLFLALVVDAVAIAGQAMVAKGLGEGSPSSAREVGDRLLGIGLLVGGGLAFAVAVAAPWLGRIFTDDPAVLAGFSSIYVFLIVAQPLNALVFVGDGVAIGAAAFRMLAWSTFVAAVVSISLMVGAVRSGQGLPAVWLALTLLILLRGAALARWYASGPLAVGRDPSPSSRGG